MNQNRDLTSRNPYVNNPNSDRFTRTAEKKAGQRTRLLDAYVWGDFDVADRQLIVRLGRLVFYWGVAYFIQYGVNFDNYRASASLLHDGADIQEDYIMTGT